MARSNRAWYASSHGAANTFTLLVPSRAPAGEESGVVIPSSPLACAMRDGTFDGTPSSALASPCASAGDHGVSASAAWASATASGTRAHSRASWNRTPNSFSTCGYPLSGLSRTLKEIPRTSLHGRKASTRLRPLRARHASTSGALATATTGR